MDTRLVEGYIFLAEILYVFGEECQYVLLAVIGLFAERLVRQCTDAAVALQGTLVIWSSMQRSWLSNILILSIGFGALPDGRRESSSSS